MWNCLCRCGSKKVVMGSYILSGRTASCGCLSRDAIRERSITHGATAGGKKNPTYRIWKGMRQRCRNQNDKINWPKYGGRGIKSCRRWEKFENFLADMGEQPPGLTLERKDNNLGYSKENCIWADKTQQANNRRTSRFLTFNNRTQTIAQWRKETGLYRHAIYQRLDRGWSVEEALTTPPTRSLKTYKKRNGIL